MPESEELIDDVKVLFNRLDDLSTEKNLIFRGHQDSSFRLQTTWRRAGLVNITHQFPYLERMIDQFKSGIIKNNISAKLGRTKFDALEASRHYGVPSPLLDFTYSPYVALFFSFEKPTPDWIMKKDDAKHASIHVIDIEKLATLWAAHLKDIKNYIDFREYKAKEEFLFREKPLGGHYPANWLEFIPHPGKHNFRMQRQQGCFIYDALTYKDHEDLETFIFTNSTTETIHTKFLINRSLAPAIFSRLEKMNISGGSLYGNPEGVSVDIVHGCYYNTEKQFIRNCMSHREHSYYKYRSC